MLYRTTEDIINSAYETVLDRLKIEAKKLDKYLKRVNNRNKLKKKR